MARARHATQPLGIGAVVVGLLLLALSVLHGVVGGALIGALFAGYGAFLLRIGPVLELANRCGAAINRSDLDEARARLVDARAVGGLVATDRLLDSHEAEIAWRAGDLAGLRRSAERGLGRPRGLYAPGRETLVAHLHAELALAAATTGDAATVRASAAAIEGNPWASGTAVARGQLALALLLVDDVPRLRELLADHHPLLSEGLDPRSRALHRALRRLAVVRATTAYRVPAHESAPRAGTARAWLARVFPLGQDLIDVEEPSVAEDALAAPAGASPAPLPAGRPSRRVGRVIALWVLLTVAVAALWSLADVSARPMPSAHGVVQLVSLVLAAVVAAALARATVAARRAERVLLTAQRAMLVGDLDVAVHQVRPLLGAQNRVVAASAAHVVASVLLRQGRFAEALVECDGGLALLTGMSRTAAADVALPNLVGLRALLFGLLGRDAESDAELARLAKEFPAFPFAPGWQLRTRLFRAVRHGDLAAARALARGRGDVGVGAHAELVAEILLADEATDRDACLALVREDLARAPETERWLRAALPGFLDRALRVRVASAPASLGDEAGDDEDEQGGTSSRAAP